MRIFFAKMLIPDTHKIVPVEPTGHMLDAEFYGDTGSGCSETHKYLRADEYYFSRRSAALRFGRELYMAMVERA